jgi:hypothetical protein
MRERERFMPEKGWYSLTVRKETAVRVRELPGTWI